VGFPQNSYPNDENFPFPSFPEEVPPPTDEPDTDTRCVRYNPSWALVLAAACDQLMQMTSWQGTPDEKKQAVNRAQTLKILLQTFEDCDMGCCYDTVEKRITSTGEMQIRVNGGDWQPDPNDPRVTAPTYPPITIDDHHRKCDAATNAATHIDDIISETSDQLGGAGSLLEIASAIALVIFALFIAPESIPALVPLILPLISGLIFLGQAAWDAYFTSDVHSQILCALFCHIQEDGTFTQAGYDGFIAQLGTDLPANAAKGYFIDIVGRIGLVGLNDYAAIGTSADADCSACDCPCDDCDTPNQLTFPYTDAAWKTDGSAPTLFRYSSFTPPLDFDSILVSDTSDTTLDLGEPRCIKKITWNNGYDPTGWGVRIDGVDYAATSNDSGASGAPGCVGQNLTVDFGSSPVFGQVIHIKRLTHPEDNAIAMGCLKVDYCP